MLSKALSSALLPSLIGSCLLTAMVGGALEPIPAKAAAAQTYAADVNSRTSPEISGVTVTTPNPPTEQELEGDNLYRFIMHHATTPYFSTPTARNLARWRGGKQSICPLTAGLDPGDNAFVTARLRALAAYVGAPVQSNPQCKANVHILFTSNPQEQMDAVMNWVTAPGNFGTKYSGGMRDLLAYTSGHAIQGWYMTTSSGPLVLNTDAESVGLDVEPVWPRIAQNWNDVDRVGTRMVGGSGGGIGIAVVILFVDTTKVAGYRIGTIADYLAMLALSMAQSPDHCDSLPSILDLMSSSCGNREKPAAITAGDLAFLKALYYRNTGLSPSLSRAAIEANMMQQLRRR